MWHYENECTNSITIFKDNVKVAEIVSDFDLITDEMEANAKFICDSCNKNR